MSKIMGGIVLFIIAIVTAYLFTNKELLVEQQHVITGVSAQASAVSSASVLSSQKVVLISSSTSSSNSTLDTNATSSVSSIASLSGARVAPHEAIAHFLTAMDHSPLPKIILPKPSFDASFNYSKASSEELKVKAQAGDAQAAFRYADDVYQHRVLHVFDDSSSARGSNREKREAALIEAREFYIRAFRGGIKRAANTLSQIYAQRSRVESLTWKKISFAVGESETYNCLRNSTICTVKDFNNMNRDELFYPCIDHNLDNCSGEDQEDSSLLALQYSDSWDFAIANWVR